MNFMMSGLPLNEAVPTVSLIVPVFNGGQAFERCIESLLAVDPPPHEVIVVDDGSSDGSDLIARHLGGKLLHTHRRQGPAAARNLGAWAATGDLIFFVDADVTIPPDAIAKVVSIFQNEPDIIALIGSYDDHPAATNLLSRYKNLLHHYVHQKSSAEGFTFWGACGVVRRSGFVELGGFDERYEWPSIEDIEFGYRLRAAQRRIRVCHELQVTHLKRWGPVSLFYADVFRRAIPWSKLIIKSRRIENGLNIDHLGRARVAASGLIVLCGLIACFWPPALVVLAGLVMALLVLDFQVLNWFRHKQGIWFTLRIIPWHWFSHFYSGSAFASVLGWHLLFDRQQAVMSVNLSPEPSLKQMKMPEP